MAYKKRKKHSRHNTGFIAVVSALVAAVALITFAKPLGLSDVPTWNELLEAPQSTPEKPDTEEPGPPAPSEEGVAVHIIDVGQGDAILIQTAQSNVLIDAGTPDAADALLAYLHAQGVEKLDLAIATHPHADHIGSMADVLERYPADRILAPSVPEALTPTSYSYEKLLKAVATAGLKFTKPVRGDTYDLGGASLTVLGPLEADAKNMNNNSIVVRLDCGKNSFLLMGDCEQEEEETLLLAGVKLRADVLKTGHHGSKTSTSQDFLDAVKPRWAAVSCGWDNSYGHPNSEVLERLEEADTEVWRTDLDGAIIFTSDGRDITVTSNGEGKKAA